MAEGCIDSLDHCPALLAALWVVVAALQECSWEEVPPSRSPPRKARDSRLQDLRKHLPLPLDRVALIDPC